jgi:glyoxylase I family protein
MIEQIDHVNLVVHDLEAMTAFYRDVLGFRVTKQVTISGEWVDAVVGLKGVEADVVYLDPPAGPRVELIYYRSPPGVSPSNQSTPNAFGLRHVAFRVSDIDSVVARLNQAGLRTYSPVATVPQTQVTYAGGASKRLVYFQDPEGNLLELCEYK